MPKTLFEKIWDNHVVVHEPGSPAVIYIDLHLVHEVTSPQAFQGLRDRGLKVRRPGPHAGHDGPQHPDHEPQPADHGPDRGQAGRAVAHQLPRVRRTAVRYGDRAPGHRARHRTRAGPDAARRDGGVRRQPYLDPRRFRGAGVRHRHDRSRARARHAMPAAEQAQNLQGVVRGRAAERRRRQGPDSGADRQDRRRRRHRPRSRIRRQRHPRALDGRPHDGLQHVDRRRRPGRHDRARRHDLSIPGRAAARRPKARPGTRRWRAGGSCLPTSGAVLRPRASASTWRSSSR